MDYHQVSPKPADASAIRQLLTAIKKGLDADIFYDPSEVDTPQMRALMAKHGIGGQSDGADMEMGVPRWDAAPRGWDSI